MGEIRRAALPRKHDSTEQLVTKVRQAEIELGWGLRTPQVCKKLEVSEQPDYRWRREYGGLWLDRATRLKELERENVRVKRLVADQARDNAILKAGSVGTLLSPPRRRAAGVQLHRWRGVSERRTCRVVGQPRGPHRQSPQGPDDQAPLVQRVIALASQYGRDGYRRVTAVLRGEDWRVHHKRVARRWLTDGSCLRLRPTHRQHVWAYDFVSDRTHDGRPLTILAGVDGYSRECLALDVQTLFVERGSPWENGSVESFNGTLRDALLARETFSTLTEAKILIERWQRQDHTVQPHSALGDRPPAPEAVRPVPMGAFQIMSRALS